MDSHYTVRILACAWAIWSMHALGGLAHAEGPSADAPAAAHEHGAAPHGAASHSLPGGDAAAADHGDGHGGVDYNKPPLPGFAPGLGPLFVFSFVLFAGFVLAARVLVWEPMIEALDAREARVNQAHADAAAAQAEAERLHAEYAARMAETHEKVQALVMAARKAAEQEKARIIAEAEAHARELRELALSEIRAARDAALADVERSLEAQVASAIEHVVGHPVG